MAFFKPPKSWQKLVPGTIEAWLVSDDPREQRLADEALEQLGTDAAQAYLQHLLVTEHETLSRRLKLIGIVWMGAFGAVFIVALVLRKSTLAVSAGISGNMLSILYSWLRQTATLLQTRTVGWALAKNDVGFIGTLLKSLSTVPSLSTNDPIREKLPDLMQQITVENKTLVPDEYWGQFTKALEETR